MSSSLPSRNNNAVNSGAMSLRDAVTNLINEAVWDPFSSNIPVFGNGEFEDDDFPHIDLVEESTQLVLKADIPGFKADDLDLGVDEHAITIEGTMDETHDQYDDALDIHHYERETGSFFRTIPLPCAIIPEKVEAHVEHGILTLTLPKVTKTVPTSKRKIAVVGKHQKKTAKVTMPKKKTAKKK